MPSRNLRREVDGRASRFESEIRDTEILRAQDLQIKQSKGLPMCSNCKRVFEEISRNCPRCDKPTMGYARPIPEKYQEEAQRGAYRRALANVRRRLS